MLADFRADPAAHPLKTPSGKIEIFSEKIASFGYDDCPGHATWLEPIEWLGSKTAERYPLHMLSDQPTDKLHSQLDHSPHSRATKVKGRQPITMHPDDAAARGIADGDLLRVFNDRGACLAAARLSDRIRRGVVRLSTGAWFDPADAGSNRPLEKHGNPNALTLDIGASKLSQGCIAQTCLVEIERFDGPAPAVTAHRLPEFVEPLLKAGFHALAGGHGILARVAPADLAAHGKLACLVLHHRAQGIGCRIGGDDVPNRSPCRQASGWLRRRRRPAHPPALWRPGLTLRTPSPERSSSTSRQAC